MKVQYLKYLAIIFYFLVIYFRMFFPTGSVLCCNDPISPSRINKVLTPQKMRVRLEAEAKHTFAAPQL